MLYYLCMAYRCDKCGKGRTVSRQQRHHRGVAGGKWKHRAPKTLKIILPNLHAYKGVFNGVKGKWRLCTKCLRKVKKEQAEFKVKTETKKSPPKSTK